MTFAFQGSQTGDPKTTHMRIAAQATQQVAAETGFTDFRCYGNPMSYSPGSIARQRLNSTPNPLTPLVAKTGFSLGPLNLGDLDPVNQGWQHMIGNLMRKYDESTLVAGVIQRIHSSSGATSASAYNTILVDDDVNFRARWRGVVAKGFQLSAQPNGNLGAIFPIDSGGGVAGTLDVHGAVTQTVSSGSTAPVMSGIWYGTPTLAYVAEGQWAADATDRDIYIKVSTGPSGGVVGLKAKYSSAATYTGDEVLYTLGDLAGARLKDQDSEEFGLIAEHVRAYWPVGATLALNDEFRILKRRAAWTPSYSTDRSIPAVNTLLYIGGSEFAAEGWNLNVNVDGIQSKQLVYGFQNRNILKTGQIIATLEPNRTVTDLTLQQLLGTRQVTSAVIDCAFDTKIGATVYRYRIIFSLPECRIEGNTFEVNAGATNQNETVRLVCGEKSTTSTYDGITLPVGFAIVNRVATSEAVVL